METQLLFALNSVGVFYLLVLHWHQSWNATCPWRAVTLVSRRAQSISTYRESAWIIIHRAKGKRQVGNMTMDWTKVKRDRWAAGGRVRGGKGQRGPVQERSGFKVKCWKKGRCLMLPCSLEKKQRHPINYLKYLGGSSVFGIFSAQKKKIKFKLLAKTRLDVVTWGVMSLTR